MTRTTKARMGTMLAGVGMACAGIAFAGPESQEPAGDGAQLEELAPRTGLPAGYEAPDVELWTPEDEQTTLGAIIEEAEGPVVLVFYRGGWCPYCTKHLSQLDRYHDRIVEAGGTIVAVSPESPEKVAETIEKTGVEYTILSDKTMAAAKEFNLWFEVDSDTESRYRQYGIVLEDWNATEEWELPVPGVFVIDQNMSIRWAHADEDYTKRVNGRNVLNAVEEIAESEG